MYVRMYVCMYVYIYIYIYICVYIYIYIYTHTHYSIYNAKTSCTWVYTCDIILCTSCVLAVAGEEADVRLPGGARDERVAVGQVRRPAEALPHVGAPVRSPAGI